MKRRQRNNVATSPYPVRRLVSRMLVDGHTYEDIDAEVQRQFPGAKRLFASTFGKWQKSAEFLRYREAREKDHDETEQTRALAEALNDGRGPESLADVIVMDVLRSLRTATANGAVSDLSDLAQVTKAVAPILRAQVAEAKLAADRRVDGLRTAHAAEIADYRAQMADLREQIEERDAEIARLRTGGKADAAAVAAQLDQVLGVKK